MMSLKSPSEWSWRTVSMAVSRTSLTSCAQNSKRKFRKLSFFVGRRMTRSFMRLTTTMAVPRSWMNLLSSWIASSVMMGASR